MPAALGVGHGPRGTALLVRRPHSGHNFTPIDLLLFFARTDCDTAERQTLLGQCTVLSVVQKLVNVVSGASFNVFQCGPATHKLKFISGRRR